MSKSVFFLFALSLLAASCARPVADFSYTGEQYMAPVTVNFENNSKNAGSFEWDFGDGTTAADAAPSHTYNASGNYSVKLKATKGGKTTVAEKRIMITAPIECLVEIETNYGTMTVQLSNATPQHRDNFIKLAEEGFYDGTLFHRVIEGFMIQGGDPSSRNASPQQQLGTGGPGYTIPAEFADSLVHVKGALSAARQGDQVNPEKRSSGSQFYIVQGKPLTDEALDNMEARKGIHYTPEQRTAYKTVGGTPFLDRDYTVFGHVVKGLDVLDKIAAVATNPGDRPKEDVVIKMKVIK
jgi:cyclophilin family peptidyl-prolyl cis-trans isomerase